MQVNVNKILFSLLNNGLTFSASPSYAAEYDPQHTMLALNMAIVSINRIITTQDRIVLEQEYQNIINNLSLENIESDHDMTALYRDMMSVISRKRLHDEDAEFLQGRYDRMEEKFMKDTLGSIKPSGSNIFSFVVSLAVKSMSSYFSYKYSKSEIAEGLNGERWKLTKEDITDCNQLQERLLNSSWNLLRQYKLPDNYRLVQRSLDDFYKAVSETEQKRKLRMLRALEKDFRVYPPYWYYRARTAQALNDDQEAHSCFEKFNETWRPVLRHDPYKVEAVKFRIAELVRNGDLSDDERREALSLLEVMTANTPREDWADNLFAGFVYFLLGEKNRGIEIVETNVDFGYGVDASKAMLAQMKSGELNFGTLPSELAELDKQLAEALTKYFEGQEDEGVRQDKSEAVKWYRKAAEQGHATAQYNLGCMYNLGEGVREDDSEAVKWYRKAAEQGNSWAQYILGNMYYDGEGVEKDKSEAVKWYRKAAEQGNAVAQNWLGFMYYNGDGVRQDKSEAVKWYRKAAEQGNASAQSRLGCMYNLGEGVREDQSEAVKWLRKAAEQGYGWAQDCLGHMYYNGYGVEKDFSEAVKWYRKAAEQGHAQAQTSLGHMYYNGYGVEMDKSEAGKWYRKATEQRNSWAQRNLGAMYGNGEGVRQDKSEAVKWYRKAAEQGHAWAQYSLGEMYYDGEGVEMDFSETAKWYRKAAEQGHASAQFHLGWMYSLGLGVEKDKSEAGKWYRKAAEQGHADAQYRLGVMYRVEKDDSEAVKWYRKAAEQGHAWAQLSLGAMYGNGEGVAQNYKTAYMWYYLLTLSGLNCNDELRKLEEGRSSSAKVSKSEAQEARAEAQRKYNEIKAR